MRRSDGFLGTTREERDEAREDVRLAVRAGLVRQFGSGLYGFAPTGERIRQNVIDVVTSDLDAIGGQRVSLPQPNYRDPWEASGRWGSFEGEMFTLENRDDTEMCLAPGHEEGVVHLVDGHVRSYDDLPVCLYRVEAKYRDDHARNGLLRTEEFTTADAYSLHATRDGLEVWYDRVRTAYERIFDALGLDVVICAADNSVMGGGASEGFVTPGDDGSRGLVHCTSTSCRFGITDEHADFAAYRREDDAGVDGTDRTETSGDCPECGSGLVATEGVEVGHVFQLGRRYADADGCRWPVTDVRTVAPYRLAVVPLAYEGELRTAAGRVRDALEAAGADVLLFDDRAQTIGERFAESDLLGIPTTVVLGNHYADTGEIEVGTRDRDTRYLGVQAALGELGG